MRLDLAPGLNGRVVRLLDKGTGIGLLRRVDPGERFYPDLGGIAVFVHPDFKAPPLETTWRLESGATAREISLAGRCANGLRLHRWLRLEGDVLRTTTRVENPGAQPVEFVLQARAELAGEDPHIATRTAAGTWIDNPLRRLADSPAGSETYSGDTLPAGEWAVLQSVAGFRVVNGFQPRQVERCLVNWSVRGPHRVTLTLISPRAALAPGGTLELDADYAVMR